MCTLLYSPCLEKQHIGQSSKCIHTRISCLCFQQEVKLTSNWLYITCLNSVHSRSYVVAFVILHCTITVWIPALLYKDDKSQMVQHVAFKVLWRFSRCKLSLCKDKADVCFHDIDLGQKCLSNLTCARAGLKGKCSESLCLIFDKVSWKAEALVMYLGRPNKRLHACQLEPPLMLVNLLCCRFNEVACKFRWVNPVLWPFDIEPWLVLVT